MQSIKLYFIAIIIFIIIDAIWLGVFAKTLYQKELAFLMGPIRWEAAILFYFLYIFGVIYFAVNPTLQGGTALQAALNGALFGLIAYATYDLTNLATVKNWPVKIVVIDLLWGTFITAAVCWLTFLLAKMWKI